ncbi:riboflavin kinase [Spiroplasma alleghenense]|uniref:riboflavin kinase n=1 Tax=Spiroplasma alleghenense TaxID=216931 RepID=A0A345Z3J9_9MOLU|nr:riboflavin kinase [Spiroplasma alleghenense]AXK51178.1 riboflavin kinase / FMN adenylyltransferase [Spiroplasma alleghenense]
MSRVTYFNPYNRMLHHLDPNVTLVADFANWTDYHDEKIEELIKYGRERKLKTSITVFMIETLEHNRLWAEHNIIEKFSNYDIDYLIFYCYYPTNIFNEDPVTSIFYAMKLNLNTQAALYDDSFKFYDNGILDESKFDCFEGNFKYLKGRENPEILELNKLLKAGKFLEFEKRTGMKYEFSEFIKEGKKIGRKIGFPTINQEVDDKLPLEKGVFLSKVYVRGIEDRSFFGISDHWDNAEGKTMFETYILDFNQDIYGWQVRIVPLEYIRENKKVNNLEELKELINKDLEKAKNLISKIK